MRSDSEAWEELYSGQARPWRGSADISFMDISPGDKVLELGCGNGKTVSALLEKGASVTGVDFAPSAVDSCMKLYGDKADFHVADVRSLPFSDETFDAVVSVHCIEHVPASDISLVSSEIFRVLKKGGKVYVRCFAEGDMRSDGKKEDVRNGILYRYFSGDDIRQIFSAGHADSVTLTEDPTRFGTVRRRLECIISKI